jgi:hypothetical protein
LIVRGLIVTDFETTGRATKSRPIGQGRGSGGRGGAPRRGGVVGRVSAPASSRLLDDAVRCRSDARRDRCVTQIQNCSGWAGSNLTPRLILRRFQPCAASAARVEIG